MPITIGQKAPNFNLPDQDKNMVSLEGLKGKNVVLLFFPAAFTGVCTKEMCQTRDELATFNGMNAQVFGISVDMLFSLGKFREANNINFQLLSDFNKEAIKAYEVVNESFSVGYKGVAKRASFVIDKNGNVVFAEVLPAPGDYPNFDGIKKALEAIK
ncbi:MAG: redoxin domain-containing protein [Bacteroidetes bacterium]|nr:MAG: redoxin domain-containing protein [Bacteroidota bacterium]